MKTVAFYFVVVMFLVVGCSSIKNDAQYRSKCYFGGKNIRTVIVHSDKGLVLTTIDVPPGMELCIFSTIDTLPNLQLMPVTVKGDLSIRTKPSSEIKPGNLAPQFAESAYRLDIKDAVAIIDTTKK